VSQTLQLEEAVEPHDAPKLQVEWSSPWREFLGSIAPALARSERRLAGEAPFGLVPLRIMVPAYVLEAFLILAMIAVKAKIDELQPFVAPRFSSHDVIYYSGDELPRTEDLAGAQSGTTGRAGGDEARHRTQTIKIARGGSLLPKVVDAPNLKLPSSNQAVANLLAIKPNPGPPPLEGLRSTRTSPSLAAAPVAPAPNAIRDYTRNSMQLDSVIAPAPSLTRDQRLTLPDLSAALAAIPPAPSVSRDRTLVAPALAPAVIPPAPSAARDRAPNALALNAQVVAPAPSVASNRAANALALNSQVVAPAPSVASDRARSTAALAANVIPPVPGGVSREMSSTPVLMTNPTVIPPPVSAPERASTRKPTLPMHAPAVIAPPPSADVSQDTHRVAGGSLPDPSKTVVPPPPAQSASGSFMSSLVGRIFGASEVVPPPPTVHASGPSSATTSLAANVVAPPPTINAAGGSPRGSRSGSANSLGTSVVAPAPSVTASGSRVSASSSPALSAPHIVPPPPSLSGTTASAAAPGGTLLATNIVPPPPSLGGGSGATDSGLGRKSGGLGAHLDAGAPPARPASSGSGANAGVVASSQPGTKLGVPNNAATGSLAMSPTGGDKPGLGGASGGTSIGHGTGTGSGMNGAGSGAAKADSGHGSDPTARSGISPAAGPGGAGNVPTGTPTVRGIDISGGSSQVTIPAFGSDPSASDPQTPGHSSVKQRQTFDVDIVATASSAGAFEPYKNLLHGEKHTMYPDTSSSLGSAAMEYAEESSAARGAFTPPQPLRTNLPEGLPLARFVVTCTLDASGNLTNFHVLDAASPEMTAKILAALHSWKFQPAKRGDQPVALTAILGFGIDTNDRF